METHKLELNQLKGYLGTELKVFRLAEIGNPQTVTLTTGVLSLWEDNYYDEFKPILRPLSDLTKEIEVNGEKFVPLLKLYPDKHILHNSKNDGKTIEVIEKRTEGGASADYKIEIDGQWRFKFSTYKGGAVGNFYVFNQNVIVNYYLYQKLYEWHFDIHSLIEKGLAIDINTLNHGKK